MITNIFTYQGLLVFILLVCFRLSAQNLSPTQEGAALHLEEKFNQCHHVVYVYRDHNSGCNSFIPLVQGANIAIIDQQYIQDVFDGRGSVKTGFYFNDSSFYSSVRYTYPEGNHGSFTGFDMSGATTLNFWAKGEGVVEFLLGGTNRRPFQVDSLPFQDGVDLRSTGTIELSPDWKMYSIDLSDNTFWVYKDSLAGANNKFPEAKFMDHFQYIDFSYSADDGAGNTCMKIDWNGGSTRWAGVFLFPPEGDWTGTQGYDLSGITKIRFKAKISSPGGVKFLLGKNGDSSGLLSKNFQLTDQYAWYEWILPANRDYSDVVGGFGFFFGGNIGTPDSSSTFIDSVYFEGVELSSDYSNLITGFSVSALKSANPDSAIVHFDEVSYDKSRESMPRFIQSFVVKNDSIDISEQNSGHTYDNALAMLAFIALYNETGDTKYLEMATLIGKAFVFAMNHDRRFSDGRLRNVNVVGDIEYFDGTNRLPGWWNQEKEEWYEDLYTLGTSAGNMAWGGIALLSLYEATQDTIFLNASTGLAQWCLDSTQTNFGFTGGIEAMHDSLTNRAKFVPATWKSTEHNIDLYALFIRLFHVHNDSTYIDAALNAKNFVYQMWDSTRQCFLTGTLGDGITPNISNIASDVQFWYIQALQDYVSPYIACMQWARDSCYLENFISPNYKNPISGYDFNNLDLDGVWFEGTAQGALSAKLIGQHAFADSLLRVIEYVQSAGPCNDGKGIVAADHHHLTTGFSWEYHNRLHVGATSWYIFAQLGVNPYYINDTVVTNIDKSIVSRNKPEVDVYPNPFQSKILINISMPTPSLSEITIYNQIGKKIRKLMPRQLLQGEVIVEWDGRNDKGQNIPQAYYFLVLKTEAGVLAKKLLYLPN